MLQNIRIRNFKKFSELDLQSLDRINVFVGNNNSGKSTVLEAINFAISESPMALLERTLRRIKLLASSGILVSDDLDYLFHLFDNQIEQNKTLNLDFQIDGKLHEVSFSKDVDYDSIQNINQSGGQNSLLKLIAKYSYDGNLVQLVLDSNSGNVHIPNIAKSLKPIHMMDNNLPWNHQLFGKIIIEKHADDIIAFLNKAFGLKVVKFAFSDNELYADIGFSKMLPVRYLGDGIVKIIGMLTWIIHSRNGICLIDEIENGVYYKNIPKLINYLDDMSGKFNVQLFITTHSNDLIRHLDGFSDLALYRLNHKFDGGVMRWDRNKVLEYINDKSADIR